jgi:hypothetical protein
LWDDYFARNRTKTVAKTNDRGATAICFNCETGPEHYVIAMLGFSQWEGMFKLGAGQLVA